MNFKPIDEMSLRHLFSSPYAREILHLSYLGPVLDPNGGIETSPDGMILDMRSSPFKTLRCEFKFEPTGKNDFAHNGRFDIAVVWSLPSGVRRDDLLSELLKQNSCAELLVLDEIRAFHGLPKYDIGSVSRVAAGGLVRGICLRMRFPSVFAAAIAASLYPAKFRMDQMVDLLAGRFRDVKQMKPQGRSNLVSAFLQTKPPLIELMHANHYRWTAEVDSVSALAEITELITANFGEKSPTREDQDTVRC